MNNKQKNEIKKGTAQNAASTEIAMDQTLADFKNSALVVSLLINMFILTTWLVVEVTDIYNAALITYLQN